MQAGEGVWHFVLFTEGAPVVSEMQVKPYNVYVTVAYPPDTDTPGFAEENKTKVSLPLAPTPVCHVRNPHSDSLFTRQPAGHFISQKVVISQDV